MDNIHCDDAGNEAFGNAPPVDCPRAESALATSTQFFAEGDPDSFVPLRPSPRCARHASVVGVSRVSLAKAQAEQPGPASSFVPTTVKNSPVPDLFNPWAADDWSVGFRWQLQQLSSGVARARRVVDLFVQVPNRYNVGASALDGVARPDYLTRAVNAERVSMLFGAVQEQLAELDTRCPDGAPVTAEAVFQRLSALSCAGCHAPDHILAPSREIGCGLV